MADDVLTIADQFRRALAANDIAAEKRLIAAYQGLYARVRDLADALVLEIAKGENMTPAQVRRLERYGRLLKTVEGELTDYGAFVKTEMSVAAREAIRMGEANARALVAIALGDKRLAARFNVLNTAVIEQLLGFLSPEGELYKRLGMLPAYTADQVANAILEGVGLGKNPKTIARGLTDAFGMGLTDSMRMMRTVQIYSYREANRASYIANGDVVQKWIWYADLRQACPSCIAMHGTVHDLSERLNDHHNGHCTMLPLVIGAKNNITPGEDWFNQQPEAYQRQTLGKSKFEAWKEGKFKFGDLVGSHTDNVYGEMRTTRSLKDLVGGGVGQEERSKLFDLSNISSYEELNAAFSAAADNGSYEVMVGGHTYTDLSVVHMKDIDIYFDKAASNGAATISLYVDRFRRSNGDEIYNKMFGGIDQIVVTDKIKISDEIGSVAATAWKKQIVIFDSARGFEYQTLVHEAAHVATGDDLGLVRAFEALRAAGDLSPTGYGRFNVLEDIAESFKTYFMEREKMQFDYNTRYQLIREFLDG